MHERPSGTNGSREADSLRLRVPLNEPAAAAALSPIGKFTQSGGRVCIKTRQSTWKRHDVASWTQHAQAVGADAYAQHIKKSSKCKVLGKILFVANLPASTLITP